MQPLNPQIGETGRPGWWPWLLAADDRQAAGPLPPLWL